MSCPDLWLVGCCRDRSGRHGSSQCNGMLGTSLRSLWSGPGLSVQSGTLGTAYKLLMYVSCSAHSVDGPVRRLSMGCSTRRTRRRDRPLSTDLLAFHTTLLGTLRLCLLPEPKAIVLNVR